MESYKLTAGRSSFNLVLGMFTLFCLFGMVCGSSSYPSLREIVKKFNNKDVVDLWIVGTFMAAHKYYGADMRYQAGEITPEDRVFHKNFPTPILQKPHPDVVKACEQGPKPCLDTVLKVAMVSGSLGPLRQTFSLEPWAPFKNYFELFQFRQTAAYYLCWYTMRRSKDLQYTSGKETCLSQLRTVMEIPEETKKIMFADDVDAVVDPRNDLEYYAPSSGEAKPFVCAELWFCPDPCYGRESNGNYITDENGKNAGNPCSDLKDDTCAWKDRANQNFDDLIKNKFNITCNCNSDFPGFEWDSKYELCVDKDECYDGTSACQGRRICKNSVGSYLCTCPRGYEVNKITNDCEKTAMLHKNAKIIEYKPKAEEFEKGDFIDDLMEIFGLSSGHIIKISTELRVIFTFGFFISIIL